MAVDMLRSCSVQRAEFGTVPGTTGLIRWYLCKPGAKVFPGWNAFVSPVWEPQPWEWTTGPGVYEQNLHWSPNHIPCPPGQEFHGEESWYQDGIPPEVLANPEPYERPDCSGYATQVEFGSGSGMDAVTYDTVYGSFGQIYYDYYYTP